MTLDIGPGRNWQPHSDHPILRLDKRMDARPSVVGDAVSLPFRDLSFSTVYSSHVLEHFHIRDAERVLQDWWRVVKPGGELQVFVPNLEWCALQIVNGICDEFVINALHGRQEYELDVHRSGFTPSTLYDLLNKLEDVEWLDMRTFRNSICVWMGKCTTSH